MHPKVGPRPADERSTCAVPNELRNPTLPVSLISVARMAMAAALELLGSVPLLQRLPGDSFQRIVERAELRHFGAGELVVKEREPGKDYTSSGRARLRSCRREMMAQSGTERGFSAQAIILAVVSCVVVQHEQAQFLSPASTWRHQPGDLSLVERLLQLEYVKDDMFQANPMAEAPSFWGNTYGGHMVGLALGAACKTVDPALVAHSLHSYFILGGIPSLPIAFKVERVRCGHTFATRHVQATQKGKVCFAMYASFQRIEDGLEYQHPMPPTPSPNELPTYEELLGPLCDDPRKHIRQSATSCLQMGQTLDLRYFNRRSQLTLEPQEPRQRLWVRTKGKLGDDQALHRCAAGFAFDWSFLETAVMPHSKLVNKYPVFGFSIDHSIWFHRPFRADEYLLFVMESHRACNSRALCFGQVYTQSGELVASLAQEGTIRVLPPSPTENLLDAKL